MQAAQITLGSIMSQFAAHNHVSRTDVASQWNRCPCSFAQGHLKLLLVAGSQVLELGVAVGLVGLDRRQELLVCGHASLVLGSLLHLGQDALVLADVLAVDLLAAHGVVGTLATLLVIHAGEGGGAVLVVDDVAVLVGQVMLGIGDLDVAVLVQRDLALQAADGAHRAVLAGIDVDRRLCEPP